MEQEKRKPKSKQKTTPENAEPTMGSLKRRKHKTQDINPSSIA
jgi:hypothetical protein